jgi:hypothetical protein
MHTYSTQGDISSQDIHPFMEEIRKQIDQVTLYFLIGYFCFGLGLAFFYDTYLIAISVGGLALLAVLLTKYLLPNSKLYQYAYFGATMPSISLQRVPLFQA